jgi:hypothetical protein
MRFRWHFLFGFVITYSLVYFFDLSLSAGLIIFFSSWLIDGDHYLWYSIEMKDWNPLHAIKWTIKISPKWLNLPRKKKEKFRQGIFVLHGIFFWTVILILLFVNRIFLWVFIGIVIHIVADLIDLAIRKEHLYLKICPLYVIWKNKGKKSLRKL